MKKPILAAAKDLRAQDKRLTQSDLATKILDKKWIGIACAPVSHAYLITQISKWENSGTFKCIGLPMLKRLPASAIPPFTIT